MRILAIRGENLASLAEGFAIEFEREPLRAAGLFAITGETGAGKSTILDALCLALYDKFPRVAAPGANEGAPDPSGETLATGDPRAILRRGAGRGYAEVDFAARDGRRYRARCDLMRARGRSTGKLQARGRSLWRIGEDGEIVEAVESGVEAVNRRIVELTDLTFDQFRRTALLAQGEFDAFLRAGERERADLLEKITGAEIYGLLSRRAYERWDESRRALAALEERRKEIGVLPPEERNAIVAERAAIEESRAQLSVTHKETLAALHRCDALALAQQKLAQAEADRAAASEALANLGPEQKLLADLARIEPLRPPRDEKRRTAKDLAERRADLKRAEEEALTAAAQLLAAQQEESRAAEALRATAQEVAHFAPIWEEASALDARIEAQTQEAAKGARAAEEAAQRLARAREAMAQKQADEREAAERHADAVRAFEALEAARPLSERWAEIDDWLKKRAEFMLRKAQATQDMERAAAELRRAAAILATFDAEDAKDRAALTVASTQMREREAALAALKPHDVERRLDEASRAQDSLQAMARAARDHEAARNIAAAAQGDLARFAEECETIAQRLAQMRAERAAQAALREEAERLGELADATADAHAARLRGALEDGRPCPVCGAAEHPFAHEDDAARALIETLREKRAAARQASAKAEADIAEASAREARTRALCDDAGRRLAQAEGLAQAAAQDYAELYAEHPHAGAPESVEQASEIIAALLRGLGSQQEALATMRAAARGLQSDIDSLRKSADDRREAMEERRTQRDDNEKAAREAGEKRAVLEQEIAGLSDRIESLDRSLATVIELCRLSAADLDRDADGARRRLEEASVRFTRAKQGLERAAAVCAGFVPEVARLAAESDALGEQATALADAQVSRVAALEQIRAARAELLDGEETAAHRTRFEGAQKAARERLDAARDMLAGAGARKAACDEAVAAAARAAALAQRALDNAAAAFSQALAAAQCAEEEAERLLAAPASETAAMRRLVEAAQAALRAAEAAVAQRRSDVAEALDAGLPEEPREQIAAREAELSRALEGATGRLGALQEKLARDDAALARAAELSAEIEAAIATRKVWDEVNAAIGSATGDKFRRFAQGVTLDQLVALANRRLAMLSPRYLLERAGEIGSLGLQIVDRDLGDERRSTRSLSGGERFLASLALALALAGLEGRDSFVDTLFIDEGFGALDSATLDVVVDALENLQGQGRRVGVISHVESLQGRIATKICVERRGGGVSVVRLRAPGYGG